MRPYGEVQFPANTWLKRYFRTKKWTDMRESQVRQEFGREFGEGEVERLLRNAKEGKMTISAPFCEYVYITEPMYQDELQQWIPLEE